MLFFTTLFDSFYLSRGLLLYESLIKHCPDFHLFIFAFDDNTEMILKDKNLERVTVISLNDFETPELIRVKKIRTTAEYCWTCTPSTISYVLEKYNVTHCTYIDSDLYFYSDPSVLVNEMVRNGKSVLITEHRFSPLAKLYEEKRGGRFCVQFMTFTNDTESLKVLNRWKGQCIDWCYARYEDGKFGDQKYLEEWPSIYNNVHILEHPGGGLAPWNIQQYSFKVTEDMIQGTVKETKQLFVPVFYHFQYVKHTSEAVFDIGWYFIPGKVMKLFYIPYLKRILATENEFRDKYNYLQKYAVLNTGGIKNQGKAAFKNISGYNIIRVK